MSLAQVFDRCRLENRAAVIGYLPAGFPSVDGAVQIITAMLDNGVDAIEIGLPYSDPLMDGPDIQQAVDIALRNGTTTDDVLQTVARVSATGGAAVVMSYWNPIERYGVDRFATALAQAGGLGVITPDLTIEESAAWAQATDAHDLDRIYLVAPSSTQERIAAITDQVRGFVYAASTMGVTGARSSVDNAAQDLVTRTRAVTPLPIAVGLGVSTGDQAAEIGTYADGVIVGSAFVRRVLAAPDLEQAVASVAELAQDLAAGVRRARTHQLR